MKTQLLFFLLSFVVTAHLGAQKKVISYPTFSSNNSSSLDITRIERNDTDVVLYMDIYGSPGEEIHLLSTTKLQGVTTGKEYKLLSSDGLKLDEQVKVPTVGYISFKLVFESLDKREQAINFEEGKHENDFVIKNIMLNEDKKLRPIRCHLSGTVVDRPQSCRLLIYKEWADLKTKPWISVPIRNGRFEYDFYADSEEKYQIVFWDDHLNNMRIPTYFISENGSIEFVLRPYVEGGPASSIVKTNCPLSKEMQNYERLKEKQIQTMGLYKLNETIDELIRTDNYDSQLTKSLTKKIQEATNGEERDSLYRQMALLEKSAAYYTDTAYVIRTKIEECADRRFAWELNYVSKHPVLPNLYVLKDIMETARRREKDVTPYVRTYYKVFAKKFSKTPIGQQTEEYISSLTIKVGQPYIDFSAPTLQGNTIRLSDQIRNKVALIDLWASWCGPCRRFSKSMIPVYEKYKDKGFTIVGVAREKSAEDMKIAMEKDKYPWINLIELNDRNNIWNKYGISYSAGGYYLVDKNGIILAVEPSKAEIEAILEKILK